jgi:hypothetical protein
VYNLRSIKNLILLENRKRKVWERKITINILLILKVREIIFFVWAKHIIGHFEGFSERERPFLKRSKAP